MCREALGQRLNESECRGRLRRRPDLGFRRLRPAIADIVGDGRGEQHRLLRYNRQPAAQIVEPQLTDIDTVDPHRALLGIVEAQQQVEDRCLACPRWADDRYGLARRDRKIEAIERQRVGSSGIAEGDVVESNAPPNWLWRRLWLCSLEDNWWLGLEFRQTLSRARRPLQIAN